MDNFSSVTDGYDRKQVNDFIDYVIEKTEKNILTIKSQQEEIKRLEQEVNRLQTLEYNLNFANANNEKVCNELKEISKKEADLIISEAKNNANRIVNEALMKAEKIELQKQTFKANVKEIKNKLRTNLLNQLEKIDEIEYL